MQTEDRVERRGRARTPLLTLLAAAAVMAVIATGVQSLGSATNASAVAAAPAATAVISDPAGGSTAGDAASLAAFAVGTPVVPSQACEAMGPTARQTFCAPTVRAPVVAPLVTWQACHSMDAASYRLHCHRGDGGRWIEGFAG